jgi:hypothetical protein
VIEVYLRSVLGEWGWQLLQLLLAHRLLVSSLVVGGYLAYRVFRWTRRRMAPDTVRR